MSEVITIEILFREIQALRLRVSQLEEENKRIPILEKENAALKARLSKYKTPKNSNNSSIPPSQDENRPKRKSLSSYIYIFFILFYGCKPEYLPLPEFSIQFLPLIGDTTIYCEFWIESEKLYSYNDGFEYRWDFEGDGSIDLKGSGAIKAIHKFPLPGIYNTTVELRDAFGQVSTSKVAVEILGSNKDIDVLIDSRDGEQYIIALVAGNWWMAENLRYGAEIPLSKRQEDNGIPEKYVRGDNRGSTPDRTGGVYHWLEVMDYSTDSQGLCPQGWHIPTDQDWTAFFDTLSVMNQVQYIKFLTSELSSLRFDNGIKLNLSTDPLLSGNYFDKNQAFWSS
ncbi:MAG: FISUMP domain-containing protein [Bacteroidota bacterium]|nr:FISUMP domain-containing protein [Bacteroidota bacterium]